MSDNAYRTILGAILLVSLYFDIEAAIYALAAMMLLEGITNWRVPKLINRGRKAADASPDCEVPSRFDFEAERAFRIAVPSFILATYPLGPDSVFWFFPWFIGFAIFGAGVSGICPMLAFFRWAGLR